MLPVSASFPSRGVLVELEQGAQFNPKEVAVDKCVSWYALHDDPLPCNGTAIPSQPPLEVGPLRLMEYATSPPREA